MLHESDDTVQARAGLLAERSAATSRERHVVRCESVVGGGSVPGPGIPSWGVRVGAGPAAFAGTPAAGSPPVFCRTAEDHVLLDARTITDDQVPHVARAVLYALEGDDLDDED